MARGDTYICRVCGKNYIYCEPCAVRPIPYMDNSFCCKEHADIFAILSRHGCGLATADETLEALKAYDLEHVFNESVEAHIQSLFEAANNQEEVE